MTPYIWADGFGNPGPISPRLLALDLSLTSTGFARTWADPEVYCPAMSGTIPTDDLRGVERLQMILRNVYLLCGGFAENALRPHIVGIEGYAYAASNRAHQIGELGGVIRLALYQRGIPFIEIPPANVKKIATGVGNAGKYEVLTAAVRRLGYGGSSDDAADALWILEILKRQYATGIPGVEFVNLPQKNLGALDGIKWPTIAF